MAWKMAWKSVLANKLRSFLSILGILIGVISLVVLVSIVSSATGSITDTISSLGTDLLSVSITDDKENPLRLAELDTLMEEDDISLARAAGADQPHRQVRLYQRRERRGLRHHQSLLLHPGTHARLRTPPAADGCRQYVLCRRAQL